LWQFTVYFYPRFFKRGFSLSISPFFPTQQEEDEVLFLSVLSDHLIAVLPPFFFRLNNNELPPTTYA
jgi:hypothetical protein